MRGAHPSSSKARASAASWGGQLPERHLPDEESGSCRLRLLSVRLNVNAKLKRSLKLSSTQRSGRTPPIGLRRVMLRRLVRQKFVGWILVFASCAFANTATTPTPPPPDFMKAINETITQATPTMLACYPESEIRKRRHEPTESV